MIYLDYVRLSIDSNRSVETFLLEFGEQLGLSMALKSIKLSDFFSGRLNLRVRNYCSTPPLSEFARRIHLLHGECVARAAQG